MEESIGSSYSITKQLGVGAFSEVRLGKHQKTQVHVAVKIFEKKNNNGAQTENIRNENAILAAFQHPHIVRLYEVVESESHIYSILEHVSGGDLFDYIVERARLPEQQARLFFQQIISGVEYCHLNMVAHRDLKPENLLLNGNKTVIKIADFGLSHHMEDGCVLKTSCGSPNYAAPEVISGKLYSGPEVDVWSLGVTLFAMLVGSLPFDSESIPVLYKKITKGEFRIPSYLSESVVHLLLRMLNVDSVARITVPEIRAHPWFRTNVPPYLQVSTKRMIDNTLLIDDAIVERCVALGYVRGQVVAALKVGSDLVSNVSYYRYNKLRAMSVVYHLLLDQKQASLIAPEVKNQLLTSHAKEHLSPAGPLLAMAARRKSSKMLLQGDMSLSSLTLQHTETLIKDTPRRQSEGRQLMHGLCAFTFRARRPGPVMTMLLSVLKAEKFDWKLVDAANMYQIKARYPSELVHANGRAATALEVLKLHISMYGVAKHADKTSSYVVDIRRQFGQTFHLFATTSRILNLLRDQFNNNAPHR